MFWPCEALAELLTVWPAGFSSPLGQLICQSGSTSGSMGPRGLHPQQRLASITFILPSPIIISPSSFHFLVSSSCSRSRLFSSLLPSFLLLPILLLHPCNLNQFPYFFHNGCVTSSSFPPSSCVAAHSPLPLVDRLVS